LRFNDTPARPLQVGFKRSSGFFKHWPLVCVPFGVSRQKRAVEVALHAPPTITEHVLPLAQRLLFKRVELLPYSQAMYERQAAC
jgi:hypothetical protein